MDGGNAARSPGAIAASLTCYWETPPDETTPDKVRADQSACGPCISRKQKGPKGMVWLRASDKSRSFIQQLNLVTIRVLNKCQHRRPMLHRSRLPHHFAPQLFNLFTGGIHILHPNGDMAKAITDLIRRGIPIVG